MGFFGNLLGQALGGLGGGLVGHRDTGAQIGGTLGNLLPFKKGGKVSKGKSKKSKKAKGMVKGSKEAKEKMAKLRAMRK